MLPRISNNAVSIARTTVTGTASTINSGYVDMSKYMEILAKINTGAVGGTVDASLVQATDAAGSGSKAISGKVCTQITSADQYCEIEFQQDEKDLLDLDNGFCFIGIEIIIAGASFASGEIISIYQSNEDNVPTDTVSDEIIRRTI